VALVKTAIKGPRGGKGLDHRGARIKRSCLARLSILLHRQISGDVSTRPRAGFEETISGKAHRSATGGGIVLSIVQKEGQNVSTLKKGVTTRRVNLEECSNSNET